MKQLYLGCQWKELPIERDANGRREIHYTGVWRAFRGWEADGSGSDGAQLQIHVGDDVPGFGRVTGIAQRGAAWVVQTTHGTIQ